MDYKKAIIDRFEERFAVLRLDDDQELRVNRDWLPFDAEEGEGVAIQFRREEDMKKNSQELASALLDEIFNKSRAF
ncbi:MAG: DUF3006 domain-containing protein [Candidatus Jacksonbacteria bacterium]|nr:DUF3006 domain-containing protein [Candidatus Jacksonbacteria bacterium]